MAVPPPPNTPALASAPQTSNTLRSSSDALLRTAEIISRSNTPESYFLTSQALLPALFGKKENACLFIIPAHSRFRPGTLGLGGVGVEVSLVKSFFFLGRKLVAIDTPSLGLGAVRC